MSARRLSARVLSSWGFLLAFSLCCPPAQGRTLEPADQPDGSAVGVIRHVENGTFDTDLRAWRVRLSQLNVGTAYWADSDSGGSSSFGSVGLFNSYVGPAWGYTRLAQCLTHAVPGSVYEARTAFRAGAEGLSPNGAEVSLHLVFHSTADCASTSSFDSSVAQQLGPQGTGNQWLPLLLTETAPAGTRSLSVELQYLRQGSQPPGGTNAYFDSVYLLGSFGFAKGDLNGDGETDLLLRSLANNAHAVWFMNDEQRLIDPVGLSPASPADAHTVGVDDFDRDGRNDLLMWHPVSGASEVWLMNGAARQGAPLPVAGALAPPWRPSATADFNHDGRPDLVYRNDSTQKIRIWAMNGATHIGDIAANPDQAVDANWEIVGAVDLNGDGNTDFLWYNASSGRIVYWLMNASVVRTTGGFTNPMSAGDSNWKVLAVGDYGIGPTMSGTPRPATQDLVWRNATSGRMVIWFMDGAGNRTGGAFVSPDPPAPGFGWTVVGPR